MYKEFVQTSPDTVLVKRDDWTYEERHIQCSDVERQLILENNLEYINNIIIKLEAFLDPDNKLELEALLSSLEFPVILTLTGSAMGALYNEKELIGLGLGIGGVVSLLSFICVGIPRLNDAKHQKIAYQHVLEKAYIIRDSIEKELIGLRNSGLPDASKVDVPIRIFEDKDFMESTTKQLNNVYQSNVSTRKLQKASCLPF